MKGHRRIGNKKRQFSSGAGLPNWINHVRQYRRTRRALADAEIVDAANLNPEDRHRFRRLLPIPAKHTARTTRTC